jgi:hypothetical protein
MTNFSSGRLLLLSFLVASLWCVNGVLAATESNNATTSSSPWMTEDKPRRICSVQTGLELTRLTSVVARNVFQGAIDDVELMREYVTEAMAYGGGLTNGFDTLDDVAASLDWQARGLKQPTTTVEAGLGWADDREDRRVELTVTMANEPLVGSKEADLILVQTLSSLLPWIVDRKSLESLWWLADHQNGRSEGDAKPKFGFGQLYTAAFIVTYGEATLYYPPLSVFGHPLTLADVLGPLSETHDKAFVAPNLPENDPARRAKFSAPYPDTAVPGVALVTAMAPVYYTGEWHNYTYKDTYVATVGIDIKIESVASLLSELEGTLTVGSFAFLVDSEFHMIVISPSTVGKIYPSRTGFEESRVTYDALDGSIVEDRRNQTYLPSDTILQDLTSLMNANWKGLKSHILELSPGGQGYEQLNVTLTNHSEPTLFYVMYERWDSVDDLVLVALAPVVEVENAINVRFLEPNSVDIQLVDGETRPDTRNLVTFANEGTLDVMVSLIDLPSWIELVQVVPFRHVVKAGETLEIEFDVLVENLKPGTSSKMVTLNVEDAYYPDCTFSRDVGFEVTVELQSTTSWFDTIGIYQGMALAAVFIVLIILALLLYNQKKHNRDDAVWRVQKKDLILYDPPEIIGQGTFGLILKAEYRGTQVAVKRIMPPQMNTSRGSGSVQENKFQPGIGSGSKSGDGSHSETGGDTTTSQSLTSGASSFKGKKMSQGAQWKKLRSDFIEEMRYISKLRHPCITTVMGRLLYPMLPCSPKFCAAKSYVFVVVV